MSKQEEIAGGGYRGAVTATRMYIRTGEHLHRAEHLFDRLIQDTLYVQSWTVRFPQNDGEEYLVVVRAYVEGEAKVAFHSSGTLAEALVGTITRLQNRSLKWKEDQYAK